MEQGSPGYNQIPATQRGQQAAGVPIPISVCSTPVAQQGKSLRFANAGVGYAARLLLLAPI